MAEDSVKKPEQSPVLDIIEAEQKKITGSVEYSRADEHDKLYEACQRAQEWADSGIHPKGSNYWMVMFVDRLMELGSYTTPYRGESTSDAFQGSKKDE